MARAGTARLTVAAANPSWRFTAFGLTISSELPVQGSEPSFEAPRPGHVRIDLVDPRQLRRACAGAELTCLLERLLPDGSLGMRVEMLNADRFLVSAPGHGDFSISSDGTRLSCAPAASAGWRWQRPLFGQVLPLAAMLHGFELLHASAVGLDGIAIAFTGSSGAGKTSVAAHLAASGADLLTDDVLALECGDERVIAHPGVSMINVAAEQLAGLSSTACGRLGRLVGVTEKLHLEPACMCKRPMTLGRLYFVERGADADDVVFEPLAPPDPQQLLGATFLPHVAMPGRLLTQLQACAGIACHARSFRLVAPARASAADLAAAVQRHVAAVTRGRTTRAQISTSLDS